MRAHMIVHGVVQGVGYRHLVKSAADRYGIMGWVRNLPDGGVEVLAEGEEKGVEAFVAAIHANREGGPDVFYIEKVEEKALKAKGAPKGFIIEGDGD